MKTIVRSIFLIGIAAIFSSSAWVKLTLLGPADIDVPHHIRRIAIVDRTAPSDKDKNFVESTLTGEAFRQDEQAAREALEGFIVVIQNTPRFEIVRITEKYTGSTSGTVFPDPLSWSTILQLCEKYKVDAIVALETFDTDFIVTNAKNKIEKKDKDGNPIIVIEYTAQGVATINMGFRFYDLKNKVIIDQFTFSEKKSWDATGKSVQEAVAGLLDKTAAMNQVSNIAGQIYASRISPTWYSVTRYFFNKPKKNKKLIEGVRKSEVADWKGAIESWEEAIKKGKKDKDKGRATYNIAIAYEVLGDMDKAVEWAQKAYIEYGEKDADDYLKTLKRRINNDAITKQQMGDIPY